MTKQEFICICKVFISIKLFSKDLQIPSFKIKHSSEALKFKIPPPPQLHLDQTVCSGVEKANKLYPALEPRIWTGLDWTGLDWTGLDWTGLDWTGLEWNGLDWIGLDLTGLDWTGLDWTGLDWIGLDWT